MSDTGRWLLFDNAADPYQFRSLVEDPAQAPLMTRFDELIRRWLVGAGDGFSNAANTRRIAYLPI